MRLTDEERGLAALIDFDVDLLQLIKDVTKKPLERALRFGPDGETPADGVSVRARVDVIVGFVNRFQAELTAGGYSTFWSMRSEGRRPRDEMVVLKTLDDREIVRWRSTAGRTTGVSTGAILSQLDRWAATSRFKVIGAGPDWAALAFTQLPDDVCAFAAAVTAFCPESVGQNVGDEADAAPETVAAARALCPGAGTTLDAKRLARYLRETNSLFLWWE